VLISLITAINQITYRSPGIVLGLLREARAATALPFYGCKSLRADRRPS